MRVTVTDPTAPRLVTRRGWAKGVDPLPMRRIVVYSVDNNAVPYVEILRVGLSGH